MNVGSLFTGIGGFDLGLERAGMRVVWQCEADDYCQRVLAKHWPEVPCYPDVRELKGGGIAAVDVLCGGFPCQDLSVAGKGAGIDGARSGLWSEYARLIGELRPRYVIVENVSALLARGFGRVLGDLATLGYDAEWDCIPASAIGAPHQRDRVWLVAHPSSDRVRQLTERDQREGRAVRTAERGDAEPRHDGAEGPAAGEDPDADSRGREIIGFAQPRGLEGAPGRVAHRLRDDRRLDDTAPGTLADTERSGRDGRTQRAGSRGPGIGGGPGLAQDATEAVRSESGRLAEDGGRCSRARAMADADSPRSPHLREGEAGRRVDGCGQRMDSAASSCGEPGGSTSEWWAAEPDVGRVAHGVPARVDRLRGLGNALVPQIAEWIGHRIMSYEERETA